MFERRFRLFLASELFIVTTLERQVQKNWTSSTWRLFIVGYKCRRSRPAQIVDLFITIYYVVSFNNQETRIRFVSIDSRIYDKISTSWQISLHYNTKASKKVFASLLFFLFTAITSSGNFAHCIVIILIPLWNSKAESQPKMLSTRLCKLINKTLTMIV